METTKIKDEALRQAVKGFSENTNAKLPSNFAYTTMRRIAAEQQRKARRMRIVTIASVSSVTAAGIATIIYYSADNIKKSMQTAIASQESFDWLLPMLICLTFFATLNNILRKHFK